MGSIHLCQHLAHLFWAAGYVFLGLVSAIIELLPSLEEADNWEKEGEMSDSDKS
jgi:sorbitol-specific phosphotransferase system component IIC